MRLWTADEEKGLMLLEAGACRGVGPPGRLLCADGEHVYCAGDRECIRYDRQGRETGRFPVPAGGCGLEEGNGLVYLLSSDCDSLSAWEKDTGSLAFSAPAGVYPRGLAMSPDKRYLAAAGGAAGEVLLFNACLEKVRSFRVPGVAVGVCFLEKGLAALCAAGDGRVGSVLLRISPLGVVKELFSCKEAPCCLCPAGDGCAAGCHGAVYFLTGQGKVKRILNCPYPEKIRLCGGVFLISDPWQGKVLLGDGSCVYAGAAPADAALERDGK